MGRCVDRAPGPQPDFPRRHRHSIAGAAGSPLRDSSTRPAPFHPFTLSPFHPFTLSPFHPFTLSRSLALGDGGTGGALQPLHHGREPRLARGEADLPHHLPHEV